MNWLFGNKWVQLVIVILVVGGLIYITKVYVGVTVGIGDEQIFSQRLGRHK